MQALLSQKPRALVSIAAVLVLAGGACSGHATTTPAGAVVRISEHDFQISARPWQVPAGTVRLVVSNLGPDTHELIVVRATDGPLPMRSDGLTVSEEALKPVTVGSLDGGAPGSVRDLVLHLRPGHYVVFCNMFGHYMGGMHADLVVH